MTDSGVLEHFTEKIRHRTAGIGVIGLGYVGLPMASALAKAGFFVQGVDVDQARVDRINQGVSYIADVSAEELRGLVAGGRLRAAADYALLERADVILICVPTPFTPAKAPDLSYICEAAQSLAKHLVAGQLVILQSTTHPGTTEEVVLPILETSGLKAGRDFYLAFSPERINPGDKLNTVANTPKVVGGIDATSAELARVALETITPQVFIVSSPRTAEMTKLLENIFRSVNIALVNELALLCERMGIDIWEVIEAASTKPFGFMPFYPGAGVGGHCIPVDPYYLSWKAREYDFHTKFIELAAEVNQSMPYHVVERIAAALNAQGKPLRGSRILVLGVAFKRDVDDSRNSPAERVIELLVEGGAAVSYHDPYVPNFRAGKDVFLGEQVRLESVPLTDEAIAAMDCVVIVTGHSCLDSQRIVDLAKVVVDSCNATKGVAAAPGKIVKLGAPR